jgi:hypothetical protein
MKNAKDAAMEFTARELMNRGSDAGLNALDLAILAAWPDLQRATPEDALKYLEQSKTAIERVELEKLRRTNALLALEKEALTQLAKPRDYKDGVKFVTAIPLFHRDKRMRHFIGANTPTRMQRWSRAEDQFKELLKSMHTTKAVRHLLAKYQKEGFAEGEALKLRRQFLAWKYPPVKKKGKQGQVKNPVKDKRTMPRPTGIRGMKAYLIAG